MTKNCAHVLLVDDDTAILTTLQKELKKNDYTVSVAQNGEDALALMSHIPFHLVILDVGLPGISGLDVCRTIRERLSRHLPIIILSARGDEAQKEVALRIGANDYVSKPFDIGMLNALIRAYLLNEQLTEQVFSQGPLKILFSEQCVLLNGQNVFLTLDEYRILEILARNRGRLVTFDALLHELSSSEMLPLLSEEDIVVLIHHIRKKIEQPVQQKFIITHHRLGYRFKSEQ